MSQDQEAAAAVAEPVTEQVEQPAEKKRQKPKRQPPYNVILWNDDEHSYQYVIEMLQALCGHPPEKGYELATDVDNRGKAIVMTTTLERAELKRDQIHAYGKDRDIRGCKGSMSATIEPTM
jgi:ATP-dependent Clp protease adaptor protein ClpS